MIMDMQIGLFCGIFSIIASLIVYAIMSVYSIKEDSFDEAKANRRKLIKEYIDQSRTSGDKSKQKKSKKSLKKSKEKKADSTVEALEVQKEPKTPNNSKEALPQNKEIVQVKEIEKIELAPAKIIMKNKSTASNTNTTYKEKAPEMSSINSNELKKKIPELKKKTTEKKLKSKVVESQLEPDVVAIIIPKDAEKNSKKIEVKIENIDKKKHTDALAAAQKQTGTEKQVINVNFVLSVIQKAELSRNEIQLLVNILLNSCEDKTSDWLKVKKLEGRQDSTVKLKKQLTDLETTLQNEKHITLSLQNKLKELRSDMASDKTNVSFLKESLNKLQQEKDDLVYEKSDLNTKVKSLTNEKEELHRELTQESMKTKQMQKQDDDLHQTTVLALKDEINVTISQLETVEDEYLSLKSNYELLEEEFKTHQNCQERIADLEKDTNLLKDRVKLKDTEIITVKSMVESISSSLEKLKSENHDLKKESDYLNNQLSSSFKQLEELKEELDTQTTKLIQSGEGQKNGKVCEFCDKHDTLKCEFILEERDNVIKQLTLELERKSESLNKLNKDFNNTTIEKDRLKELLDTTNTDVNESIKKYQSHIEESTDMISQLKNNLNEQNDEVLTIRTELENSKQRNNELRNKNWKAVEALGAAEKALSKLKAEEIGNGGNNHKNIEELKSNVNHFVKRLFPDITTIEEYKGHFNEWLRSVEEAVISNNSKCSSEDLQSQNLQLQSLVAHYKTIISDTEDMLNRLQNHIEVEESKWKEEITSLQKELDSLRALQRNVLL